MVSNAIKFTPRGGQVSIKYKIVKHDIDLSFREERLVEILQGSDKSFLEIQVEDTGIGIKEEDMGKLFQLYGFMESSKKLNTKGIGLGLFITKKII